MSNPVRSPAPVALAAGWRRTEARAARTLEYRWSCAGCRPRTDTHLLFYLRYGIRVGRFVPATYLQQVVENSDFRKFADGLRMVLDCTPDLADAIEKRLETAASAGTVRYGLHRQDAAVMTCFAPLTYRQHHLHFIDGARGGYASGGNSAEDDDRAGEANDTSLSEQGRASAMGVQAAGPFSDTNSRRLYKTDPPPRSFLR